MEGMVLVTLTTLRAHASALHHLHVAISHSLHAILHAMILGVAVSVFRSCRTVMCWCVAVHQRIGMLEDRSQWRMYE